MYRAALPCRCLLQLEPLSHVFLLWLHGAWVSSPAGDKGVFHESHRGLPPRAFFQIQPRASHPLQFPRSQEAISKATDVQQHQSPTCNHEH